MQPYTTNNLNQYKQVNGQSVLHEPAHGLSSYDGVIYSYVGDTYLAQASAGPSIYTLYYDALGRCVKRVRSEMGVETTTYYHFDGDHWILEYRPDGTVQSNILYGNGVDEIIGRHNEESGVATSYNQWPYPDRNNNTSVVTGDNGTLLEYYRYDAFGQPTIYDPATDAIRTTSAIANRFLFTGREWNPAQKFYEYRNRAYSPSLGRFMSEDPKGFDAGDYNLYRYVGNDPLDKTDPMGLYIEYTAGNKKFWDSWKKQFESKWKDSGFRDWWNKAASSGDAVYVAGPKGQRGSAPPWKSRGYPAESALPHTMRRATDGRVASQRAQEVRDNGQDKGVNLTHYGYPGDNTPDNNSRLGLGTKNNILNPDSVALQPENVRGVPFGAPVQVNGHFIGYYHDQTAPRLDNGPRVDVYDPSNSFR